MLQLINRVGFREKELVSNINILVVDADASVRLSLTHLLEHSGYGVQAIMPGQNVLDHLDYRINLLLLEIDIPVCNGLLLLDTIRRFAPTLPIIILTSCHHAHMAASAHQFSINSYLVKPINPASLLRQIEVALASRPFIFP
jgi:DNA-binding NtrC family response regulator